MRAATLALTDGYLNYGYSAGSASPVLFLHGVLRCWEDVTPLLPGLLARHQVFSLSFRGHGGSTARPGSYHVVDYRHDVINLLNYVIPGYPVLYGHSLGALVALVTAAQMPERITALILEDPPGEGLLRSLAGTMFEAQFRAMQRFAGDPRPIPAIARDLAEVELPGPNQTTVRLGSLRDVTSLRFSAKCLKAVDPEVLAPILDQTWLDGFDLDALLAAIRCPTLILRGNEKLGGMLDRAEAEQWAARLQDPVLVDLPNTGHLLHWMETATTVRHVCAFLESL